jgi:hypothetical protein
VVAKTDKRPLLPRYEGTLVSGRALQRGSLEGDCRDNGAVGCP